MKIGVSSYSFQQYIKRGEMKAEDTLIKAAEMGFDGIEFISANLPETVTEEYAENLKRLAKEHGIEICAYLTGGDLLAGTEAAAETICKQLDVAAMLGVKLFRYDIRGSLLPRYMSCDEAIEILAPYMRKIAEYGEKLGIMTMIENHGLVFQDWERVEKLYNKINHKSFSLLIDIGNFMCADVDNVECVSKLANLASHVHLKDMIKYGFNDSYPDGCFTTRGCNRLLGTTLGCGDAKVAQCIEILKKAGYDGYMNIEYEGTEDCIEGIRKGLEFARGLI